MFATEFPKFYISWGHAESFTSGKSFLKVDISTCTHSYHEVVAVGPTRVAGYGKFQVFSLIEGSPVGIDMINHFNHIDPWGIVLSGSKSIQVSVILILRGLGKLNLLGGSFLALAHFVEMWNSINFFAEHFSLVDVHTSYISCTCPPSLGVF